MLMEIIVNFIKLFFRNISSLVLGNWASNQMIRVLVSDTVVQLQSTSALFGRHPPTYVIVVGLTFISLHFAAEVFVSFK